jgi:GNAT superfamily N-acetyltransferase
MRPLQSLWMKLFTTFYRRVTVHVATLDPSPPVAISKIAVRVELLAPEMIDAYARFRPSQSREALRRFALGHMAGVAWHGDRIVGAAWMATGRIRIPYLDCDIVLPPDAIYTYDAHTLSEYRGNNIARARAAQLGLEFLGRGLRRSVSIIAVENRSGLRSALKSGYRVVGTHSFLRLGPVQRHWNERLSDDYPVFAASSPVNPGSGAQ